MADSPLRDKIRRRTILITGVLVLLGCAYFIGAGAWVWEVRVPARQGGALRLVLPQDFTALTLHFTPQQPRLGFLLADSAAAAQDFWAYRSTAAKGLARCTYDPGPCQLGQNKLTLRFSFAPDSTVARRMYQREAFLIPLSGDDPLRFDVGPATTLYLDGVSWPGPGGEQHLSPGACASHGASLSGPCRFVDTLLARPTVVNSHDPQPYIVSISASATARLVPALILAMIVVNVALLAVMALLLLMSPRVGKYAVGIVERWLRVDRSADGASAGARLTLHVDQVLLNWRRLFEYLEVTGPALGFLLTVGALLLAFDPVIFTERDTGRFTQAMSMALTATFAGLLMRILAFSCDRMTEFLLRQDANPSGFLKTAPPSAKPLTASGESLRAEAAAPPGMGGAVKVVAPLSTSTGS